MHSKTQRGGRDQVTRWASEAAFFDRVSAEISRSNLTTPDSVVDRYRVPRRPWFVKEFKFRVLGDVAGRHVLDVGCGTGENAVLMAKLGARVTAVDISPGSIEVARRRAAADGVENRVRFVCAPLEVAELPDDSFDAVWGDGFLHHVISELPAVFETLLSAARSGATFVFAEPVSYSKALRRLRGHVPIHTDATPDERPLEDEELRVVRQYLPGVHAKHFGCFGRLNRFVLRGPYETAAAQRKALVDAAGIADELLLWLPLGRTLASYVVLWGRAPARAMRPTRRDRVEAPAAPLPAVMMPGVVEPAVAAHAR